MDQVREIASAFDDLSAAEAAADLSRLQAAIVRVRRAMIALGAVLVPGCPPPVAAMDEFFEVVYPRLRRAYRAAGLPGGPDEDGMWRWLRQHAAIAAEVERIDLERAWQRGLTALRDEIELRRSAPAARCESAPDARCESAPDARCASALGRIVGQASPALPFQEGLI
jgi:hypothetical protein